MRHGPDPTIDQLIGKYRVVRQIGAGGMGAVYEGVHQSIQQRAAIKVLRPDLTTAADMVWRFFNEARAVNVVQHPGVVKIFDFGQLPDGRVFILMEYLDGETLERRLRTHAGRLPLPDALRVARQIADVLAAAHERGIVHRDLKPGNVFLVPEPEAPGGERAKLLDFGIAKILSTSTMQDNSAVNTATGEMLGTPTYMAPEQCRGLRGVDDRVDVYALGIVLYQMLSGRPPFQGRTAEVLAMHLLEKVRPLQQVTTGVPRPMVKPIHVMIAKDPDARPRMRQVAAALTEMAAVERESSAGQATQVGAEERGRRRRRRAALAALALSMVGGLALGGRRWLSPPAAAPPAPPGASAQRGSPAPASVAAARAPAEAPAPVPSRQPPPGRPREPRAPARRPAPKEIQAEFVVVRPASITLSCGTQDQLRPVCYLGCTVAMTPGMVCAASLPGYATLRYSFEALRGQARGSAVRVPLNLSPAGQSPRPHREGPARPARP